MPKSPLTHLNELERLVVALEAVNGLLSESDKDLSNVPTIIGVLANQMNREIEVLHATTIEKVSAERYAA